MPDRYGTARVSNIRAAIQDVRSAVQHGDPIKTREAWDQLEGWLPWLFEEDKKQAPPPDPRQREGN